MQSPPSSPPECPYCRSPIQPGYLGVATYQALGTARWFDPGTDPLMVGLPLGVGGGEVITSGGLGGVVVYGYRCTNCRTIILRY